MDYHIDAKDKRFGRLASEIAVILQGKKSPVFNPRLIGQDKVYLSNYKELTVSGKKLRGKIYHRHTGYMGHLKSASFEESFEKNPKQVIRDGVRRMLPKNFLNQKRLKNLIFVETKNEK